MIAILCLIDGCGGDAVAPFPRDRRAVVVADSGPTGSGGESGREHDAASDGGAPPATGGRSGASTGGRVAKGGDTSRDGGSTGGEPSRGGAGGAPGDGGVPASGGSTGDAGGAAPGDSGATPGIVVCGDTTCDLGAASGNACCVRTALFTSRCDSALTGCALNGGQSFACDDTSDCASGQVCCSFSLNTITTTRCAASCTGLGAPAQLCRTDAECGDRKCVVSSYFAEYSVCR